MTLSVDRAARGTVRATLTFVARSDEPLYNFYVEPPSDRPPSNELYEEHEIAISDLRAIPGGARFD